MNHRRQSAAGFWTRSLACATALFGLAGLGRADEEPWPPPPGTQVLRAILKAQLEDDLLPLREEELRLSLVEPSRTLIIVFGNPSWLTTHFAHFVTLKNFVQHGGALLVATDEPTLSNPLAGAFGVGVAGSFLKAGREDDRYQGFEECILVREFSPHPIFAGVSVIATNKPSFLTFGEETLQRLAKFPTSTWVDGPRFRRREPRYMLAAGNDVGEGRILVVADHSIFINQMLQQKDSNNCEFASNCMDWLTEKKDGGRRTRVLFVEHGTVVTDFRASLKPVPRLRTPSALEVLARLIEKGPALAEKARPVVEKNLEGLEKENFFNRQAAEGEEALSAHHRELIPWLIILTSFGFLCAALRRLRLPLPVPAPPRTAPGPTSARRAPGALPSRSAAMVREGRYWEAVHYLAGRLGPGAQAARLRRGGAAPRAVSAREFQDILTEYEAARKAARRPAGGAPPS